MKTRASLTILLALLVLGLTGCSSCNSANNSGGRIVVNAPSAKAADGLDLEAVGELVKVAKDGPDLERLLNQPNGPNNLDLSGKGSVDYISVQEFGSGGNKGFSLTVDLGGGNIQEVATVQVEKQGQQAVVQLQGNDQIYGSGAVYHSSFSLSDAILFAWLFQPRPVLYVSPYHYGYYPTGYVVYRPVPYGVYHSRVAPVGTTRRTTYTKTTTTTIRQPVTSPNAGKQANNIKAQLANPTKTQREFQVREQNKAVSAGGFGRQAAEQRVKDKQGAASGTQQNQATKPAEKKTVKADPPPSRTTFTKRGRK